MSALRARSIATVLSEYVRPYSGGHFANGFKGVSQQFDSSNDGLDFWAYISIRFQFVKHLQNRFGSEQSPSVNVPVQAKHLTVNPFVLRFS